MPPHCVRTAWKTAQVSGQARTWALMLHFREKSSTVEQSISPQVSAMPVEKTFWIELDASEIFQYAAVVGTASPSLAYDIQLIGYEEAI